MPIITLPEEELTEVLTSSMKERSRLVIAGFVDRPYRQLVLFLGNGIGILAPFEIFKPTPKVSPDFDRFGIIDHGQTIALGEYEASVDAIIEEMDPKEQHYPQLRKDNENLRWALKDADRDSKKPYCIGCGHERDETHKGDCLIYPGKQ